MCKIINFHRHQIPSSYHKPVKRHTKSFHFHPQTQSYSSGFSHSKQTSEFHTPVESRRQSIIATIAPLLPSR